MMLRIQSNNPLDFPTPRSDESKWIYLLRKDGKTIYVGETANPKKRFYAHRTKPFTEAVLIPSNQCPFTEASLIAKIKPALNKVFNPVYAAPYRRRQKRCGGQARVLSTSVSDEIAQSLQNYADSKRLSVSHVTLEIIIGELSLEGINTALSAPKEPKSKNQGGSK